MKEKNIKICIINPDYYRSSGVTQAIKRLHEKIVELGATFTFITCNICDSKSDDYFSTVHYNLMKPWKVNFWIHYFEFIKFLTINKIDIMHVHHRRLLFILWPISKIKKIPLIYTGHLVYASKYSKKFIKFRNGIAINDSVKKDMENEFNFENIDIISNAINFPEKIHLSNNREKVVICIGRLDTVKNHDLLIKAWHLSKLQENEWKLYLYGEGQLEIQLKSLTHKLGISKSVIFKGFKKDWIKEAENASFAVLPSFVEGQPLVIIEAASIGIPSLVSNIPGSKDIIPKNIKLPNLFSPNNIIELSDMLIQWTKNSENLTEEANIIFEYTKNFASSEFVAKQTFEVYKYLLKEKRY